MKVRDLLAQEIDIDVYDDVCDELAIAFCGPVALTPEGERRFAEALEYTVTLHDNGADTVAIVLVEDDEGVWQNKLSKAKALFYAAAGYCSVDDFKKWFKEE